MDSVDIEVLRTAEAWRRQDRRVALGTIVKTWGSAPRPVGAMVAIRDDGQVVGSVSGGSVEDDLIDKVKARVVAANKPELVTYGVTNEEATRWRLVLIGAGQLTSYLAEMAHMLDYHVTVIDPREEYANGWDLAGVPLNRGMPDDVVRELNLDGHSAIVALTQDPKLDDLALMEALKSAAFYVGAIGSKKNNDARRERLREFDVSDEEIARLRGPVGLYIGSKTPPEIAVAILAEMTAVRHGVSEPSWAAKPERRFEPSACEVKTTT